MLTNQFQFDEKMPLNLSSDDRWLTMSPIISNSTNMFIIKTRDRVTPDSIRSIQISKNPAQIMIFSLVASNRLKIRSRLVPKQPQDEAKD